MPQGLPWDGVKSACARYLVQDPEVIKRHAATRIHSRFEVSSETLQEYIQRSTDVVIQVQVLILQLSHVT